MYKIFAFSFLFFCSQNIFGQIEITSDALPKAGKSYPYADALNIGGFDYKTSGNGVHWDFRKLGKINSRQYDYLRASQTPYKIDFGFEAVGLKQADTLGNDFGKITDVYEYYRTTASAYSRVGFAFQNPDVSLSLEGKHKNPDVVYELPLTNKSNFTGTFDMQIPIGKFPLVLGNYFQSGTRTTKVVGWGWISLPTYDSIPCLKIESVVVQNDSTSVPIQNIDFNVNNNRKEIQWLTLITAIPALEIVERDFEGRTVVSRIRYSTISKKVGVGDNLEKISGFSIYPNPTANYLHIQSDLPIQKVIVSDLQGLKVLEKENQHILDLQLLQKGVYQISIFTNESFVTKKMVKK